MSQNVYDVLQERGFIAQTTHEELRELLGKEKVTFYIGFDATADSLTAGHFLTIMAMMHMQKAGHRPIALLGGGTTMIGDPSGKSDMRNMLTKETIDHNAKRFKEQLSRFITFDDDKAILANNADWLLNLNYVDFLREVGVHFSVNKMLTAECYKQRMERGLTFFEFNYMLMQGYDFLELNRRYGCKLEMGGNDQWSNILAGADLIRRKEKKDAYGLTLTLLTFLPMDEVRRLGALEGAEINKAKEVLAYEVTKIVHGEEEAKKAQTAAKAMFVSGGANEDAPTFEYEADKLAEGIDILTMLVDSKLCTTRSDARRMVQQGGVSVNGEKVSAIDATFGKADFDDKDRILLKKGKKKFCQIKEK